MPLVDHCPLFSAIFVGHLVPKRKWSKGPFNNYVDKIRGGGGGGGRAEIYI